MIACDRIVGSRSYIFSTVATMIKMVRRLFQRLQQRVRRLLVRPVQVVDQENPPSGPCSGLNCRPLLQQPHLWNRDLPQRTVGRKRQKIRMCREYQWLFVPLSPASAIFAVLNQRDILRQGLNQWCSIFSG